MASAEAAMLANGKDLHADGAEKAHGRLQTFLTNANWAVLLLFWAVTVSLFSGVLLYAWHLLAPVSWHWLNKEQLDSVKTILTAAAFSSVLGSYVNKRMGS